MKVTIEIPADIARHIDSQILFSALEEWIQDADIFEEMAQEECEALPEYACSSEDEQEEMVRVLEDSMRGILGHALCVTS